MPYCPVQVCFVKLLTIILEPRLTDESFLLHADKNLWGKRLVPTWRRVSILRLNFEIFFFLVSEELAAPSIRTASIDCFHLLPSLLLALVFPLVPLSLLPQSLFFPLFFLSWRKWSLWGLWTATPLCPSSVSRKFAIENPWSPHLLSVAAKEREQNMKLLLII